MNRIAFAAALAIAALAGQANAAEHEIRMLNKGEKGAMVFEPALLVAAPGDTVRFVPTDKSHNAETMKGMVPEGGTQVKGKLNEEVVLTLDREGVWGVKCAPHYGMGMVALIVAGTPANLEQAEAVKQTGKAKKVFAEMFQEVRAAQ